ncbi:hypothetical protein B0H10DRAFT_2121297 [Mycena sp. CBHHK59/15]|nr:hypothetical protein B0H10DRAFT_2121297 [Mycena sp. CBHHK59/15]
MQRWRLAYPRALFSQALSARIPICRRSFTNPCLRRSCGLASGAADAAAAASTSRMAKAPNHPSLPCRRPAPADRALVIAACFPTFPERLLRLWFSCNWNEWTDLRFVYPRGHHTHACLQIHETPRPLAFREGTSPSVLVAAGVEYFLWNGDALTLTRFGADFASDEDFLARMTARAALYWRLDAEQRALAWEVDGRRRRDVELLDPST